MGNYLTYGIALAVMCALSLASRDRQIVTMAFILLANWAAWSAGVILDPNWGPWWFAFALDIVCAGIVADMALASMFGALCVLHLCKGCGALDFDQHYFWTGIIGWMQVGYMGVLCAQARWRRV